GAETAEGSVKQGDMGLSPSEGNGQVGNRLSSLINYQKGAAWTWEHLALTRASTITGPAALRQQINATIRQVLARPRERAAVVADVRAMRAKIEAEKGSHDAWDLKQVRGGLIDLELITQVL